MQKMQVQSLGWEDPLEEEMETHSSILAWKIPWTEEFGGLLIGWQRVRHNWDWARYLCVFLYIIGTLHFPYAFHKAGPT